MVSHGHNAKEHLEGYMTSMSSAYDPSNAFRELEQHSSLPCSWFMSRVYKVKVECHT